ncbi:LOW QUALITY PROTEIN: protein FAM161B [Leguminivora glycinivorella]|uniref:LOW QUALITY PROTEIN: protein FAM161B n=1 Tax=Leguminivora glycinivorella TaxID=1035111 RepID=UPI00200BB3F0|nr:LOW QUALITY PROTEIN: protein FAM161B [Leguminivora glycinivorella]
MNHRCSVFTNACLKLPVDAVSKMPKPDYERKTSLTTQNSIDSSSTCSVNIVNVDTEKIKDFYRSIPDYNEINHLPTEEFYSTLRSLRQKKKVMLEYAVDSIDDCNGDNFKVKEEAYINQTKITDKPVKSHYTGTLRRKYCREEDKTSEFNGAARMNGRRVSDCSNKNLTVSSLKQPSKKLTVTNIEVKIDDDLKLPVKSSSMKEKTLKPKRNHSACSISWNDDKIERKNEVDQKFDKFFDGAEYSRLKKGNLDDDEFKTQSMPSSPLRAKRFGSPQRRRKSITVPKPFKMTKRDEEVRAVNELRSLQKSFSEDMLHRKCDRQQFRSKPVPIESRIPLYDKILEDQAMRRAITKINSEAELRAKMKPFSFTKREEGGLEAVKACERAIHALPKPKKKKRFRARPVPKNLFSNYFYDKMKEDEFFRSMNRRIRSEEMLRSATLPGSMAMRDRSRLSTPAAHSDLPIDPSPGIPSVSSSDRQRSRSPEKRYRYDKTAKEDFITTSPKPFRFNTADRAAKKMQDVAKKLSQESKSTESVGTSGDVGVMRGFSALELRAAASGRSNLAALLRAEAVRRRFEMDAASRMAEQRRIREMRHRDRLLRSNPAWTLVKNNAEEDIAMRLQTRRDEERMRREEFLHEMELMYGRVQQQPLLFERYYAPRSHSAPVDYIQLSPRKTKKRSSRRSKTEHFNTPSASRKDSLNDYNGNMMEYLNRIENDEKSYSNSEDAIDSLDGK